MIMGWRELISGHRSIGVHREHESRSRVLPGTTRRFLESSRVSLSSPLHKVTALHSIRVWTGLYPNPSTAA